jgi:hypothetical protein
MNKTVRGTLRAYDAGDLNFELWNNDKNLAGEDRLGDFAKFCPPVMANGKVYMATFSRELVVYGLLEDIGGSSARTAGARQFRGRPRLRPGSVRPD